MTKDKTPRTLDGLEALPGEILTPAQVASVLGTDQQRIRVLARERPEMLGFPVIVIGNRVKIPKRPFIAFMTGGTRKEERT